MKRRLLSFFLIFIVALNCVWLPAAASDEQEGLLYAEGSFETQTSVRTVTHGLGWVPDMIIVYTGHLPLDQKLFFAVGYSQSMLNCLGSDASSKVFANMYGGMLSSSTKVGFENSDIANADGMGYIRSVTDQTFVIGGSTFGLDTTSGKGTGTSNPNSVPSGEKCGDYHYIAIGGIAETYTQGAFQYAEGSFETQTSVRTVTHGLGWIPDMVIVYTGHLPLDQKMFFSVGYGQETLNLLGSDASSKVFANMYGGMLSSSTKVGFENSDIANADGMGYIRSVTDQTFVIGGSTFGLDTTSGKGTGTSNPNSVPSGEKCGDYHYIAIGGLSSGGTPCDHKYETFSVPPSCEVAGYSYFECVFCGNRVKGSDLPAFGHVWSESARDPASCLTEGVQYLTCITCKATRLDPIPPTGHNYTDTVISPTCTSPGYTQHRCSGCGDIYHDTSTPSLGHAFVNSICIQCGILEGEQGTTERPCETDTPGGSTGGDPVDPDPDSSEKPVEPGESSSPSGGGSSVDPSEPSDPSNPSKPDETKPSVPGGSSSSGGGDYDMSDEDKKVLLKGLGIIGAVVFAIILFVPSNGGGKT